MFFYVGLIICVLLFFFIIKVKRNIFNHDYSYSLRFVLEFIIIFLLVFRYDVGWDYPNYYNLVLQPEEPSNRLEPFSYIFVCIARYFASPGLLFVLYGLPTYLLIFNNIKRFSCNYEFSLLIYVCLFIFDSLGLIRQALAVSIMFWGYRYVIERSFFKYLLLVGIAVCFHYSAIASILIYPLYHIRTKFFFLYTFLMFLLKELLIQIIIADGTYAIYVHVEEMMSGGNKIFIFYYCIGLFLVFFSSCVKILSSHKGMFQIIFFAFFFPLIFGNGIAIRVVSYYMIYLIILIPFIFKNYPRIRFLIGSCCIAYFFAMLWISSTNPIKSPYIPYKNIIFNNNEPFK